MKNENIDTYRTIRIYAGMTRDSEIISTNAPYALIEKSLIILNQKMENKEEIINPYWILEDAGYTVDIVKAFDEANDLEEFFYDAEFDLYAYNI